MSCCGQRMSGIMFGHTARRADSSVAAPEIFEYTGHTSLNVIGPVSGVRYFFARQGARAAVDARDAAALLGVPVLRRVNQPN